MGGSYANTPDMNVDANVNARSACDNSPCFGGPAGWSSTVFFATFNPAPRSVFFGFGAMFAMLRLKGTKNV